MSCAEVHMTMRMKERFTELTGRPMPRGICLCILTDGNLGADIRNLSPEDWEKEIAYCMEGNPNGNAQSLGLSAPCSTNTFRE